MTISIGFVRKESVSIEIELVDTNLSEQQVLEGLQSGQFEIMERSREIVNCSGGLVGHVTKWEDEDLTHGDFELFEE